MNSVLVRIVGDAKPTNMPGMSKTSFVAGVIATNGVVTRAAPIVKYMIGWDGRRFASYCKDRNWVVEVLPSREDYAQAVNIPGQP